MHFHGWKRRDFIMLLGGAAAWPLAAGAQQPTMPVVAFVNGRSLEVSERPAASFRKGLGETATLKAKTCRSSTTGWPANTIACRRSWPTSSAVASPSLSRPTADIMPHLPKLRPQQSRSCSRSPRIRSGSAPSTAWRGLAATQQASISSSLKLWPNGWGCCTIWCPRLFALLCWSIRPAPWASRRRCARYRSCPRHRTANSGPQASNSREIEAAFAPLVRERADALFIAPDTFFISRYVQFATLATHHRIPTAHSSREGVEAGGLMSYGTDIMDMYR